MRRNLQSGGHATADQSAGVDSNDVLLESCYTIWRRIKHAWPQVWKSFSKILSKVGICMTRYMTDVLISSCELELLDISDPESVGKKVDHS